MKKLRWVAVIVALLGLLAQPFNKAHAAEGEARIEAALHQGSIGAGSITWRSRFILDAQGSPEGGYWTVRLAAPLPASMSLTGPEGVTSIVETGQIVGFRIAPAAASKRALVITLVQPLDGTSDRIHLGAPLAAGNALQIVDVSGEDGARFEPDPALGLERRIGRFAPRGLSRAAREEVELLVDYRPSRRDNTPLYVNADGAVARRGGIDGILVTRADRLRGGVVGTAVAFVVVVAGLVIARRRLARAALEEEATELLEAQFEALKTRAPKIHGSEE
jgi:hypothetical protein